MIALEIMVNDWWIIRVSFRWLVFSIWFFLIGIDESFEVVNNETPPQKRRSTKERVMIRTQDPDTLVTLSTEQWQDIFRIVSERSVVRKVDGGATVSRGVVAKPIFNINNRVSSPVIFMFVHQCWLIHKYDKKNIERVKTFNEFQSQNAPLEVWNTQSASPSLTFENRLAILPGPCSIMMALDQNSPSCASCAMGKALVRDLFISRAKDEKTIQELSGEIKTMKEEVEVCSSLI